MSRGWATSWSTSSSTTGSSVPCPSCTGSTRPGSRRSKGWATSPAVGVTGWHDELSLEQLVSLVHKSAVVLGLQVQKNIACERSVFIPNHGRSTREEHVRNFTDRNLRS